MTELAPPRGATLNQVLAEMGSTLVEVAIGRVDAKATVAAVTIYDPFDSSLITENSLVLGVGVAGDEPIVDLVHQVADRKGTALLLREPISLDRASTAAIEAAGVPVIGLVRGVPWNQIATAASLAMSRYGEGDESFDQLGALGDAGDLRGLANSIAALISAPITIEDVNSNIVAFSADQDTADLSRRTAVLEQRVPETYLQRLRTSGFFHRIYAGGECVFIKPGEIYERGRVVVRVAAGESLLGSIWAVSDAPLGRVEERVLTEASRLVAVHMLRDRVEADITRRRRRRLLSALLSGDEGARSAADDLGLHAERYAVFGVQSVDAVHGDAADFVRLERISKTFELHLLTQHPHALAGTVGDTIYGILPISGKHQSEHRYLSQVGDSFVAQSATRLPVRVSVGEVVSTVSELASSRTDSDRVLRVIKNRPRRAFRIDEVQHDVFLSEMKERWSDNPRDLLGLVRRLEAFDHEHNTQLLQTLGVYFDEFGDIRKGAECLIVHPNTFRNRLKRIQEVLSVDLENPDERFNLMLQVRLSRL